MKDSHGEIDLSLESDSSGEEIPCLTRYSTIKKIELPFTVNSKFTTSRYSLLDIELVTGRWHQIRRHMNRVSHPILGDREHGDSHHNRFFREQLQIHAMCLKAYRLEFTHPLKNEQISLLAPVTSEWQKIETLFSN